MVDTHHDIRVRYSSSSCIKYDISTSSCERPSVHTLAVHCGTAGQRLSLALLYWYTTAVVPGINYDVLVGDRNMGRIPKETEAQQLKSVMNAPRTFSVLPSCHVRLTD